VINLGRRGVTFLFLVLLIGTGILSLNNVNANPTREISIPAEHEDLSGVHIAIYEGYYSFTDPRCNESKWALHHMFNWMNATVMIIDAEDIRNGALWGFEILAIPEGLGPTLESRLGDEAMQDIRDWVAAGGSYIGVRGSTSIAVTRGWFEGRWEYFDLCLVNGTTYEVEDLPDYCITNVTIDQDCLGPEYILSNDRLEVFFRTGRYFEANPGQEIICIANYSHSGLPAMIGSHYGNGTVFLSSPHFEYEENGNRDGTDYMDYYDDDDSEWPFILEICSWLIDASPTVRNMTWTPPVTTTLPPSTSTTTSSTSETSTTTSTNIATTTSSATMTSTSEPTAPQEFPVLILGVSTLVLGIIVLAVVRLKRKG